MSKFTDKQGNLREVHAAKSTDALLALRSQFLRIDDEEAVDAIDIELILRNDTVNFNQGVMT